MNKKNLTTQANDSSNSIVELPDEDLQQIVGGKLPGVGYLLQGLPIVSRLSGNTPVVGGVLQGHL